MESNVTLSDLIQTLVDHSRGKAMTRRTAETTRGRLVTREDVRRAIRKGVGHLVFGLFAYNARGEKLCKWSIEEFAEHLCRALGIPESES